MTTATAPHLTPSQTIQARAAIQDIRHMGRIIRAYERSMARAESHAAHATAMVRCDHAAGIYYHRRAALERMGIYLPSMYGRTR